MRVNKAIFPVAGLGTRFLPATKAMPKEMMPVMGKPLIQYAVEEALEAGIKHLIFITNLQKRAIEDYFDRHGALENVLAERGDLRRLNLIKRVIPDDVTCTYVRQSEQCGLGHAILCAKDLINGEAFALLLADELLQSHCLRDMLALYQTVHAPIVAVQQVPLETVDQYGIAGLSRTQEGYDKITDLIEKPAVSEAHSRYAAIGRYILTPDIIDFLSEVSYDHRKELQLTDAIAKLLKHTHVYASQFTGKRFDCGSQLGYLKAVAYYALQDSNFKGPFSDYLKALLANDPIRETV